MILWESCFSFLLERIKISTLKTKQFSFHMFSVFFQRLSQSLPRVHQVLPTRGARRGRKLGNVSHETWIAWKEFFLVWEELRQTLRGKRVFNNLPRRTRRDTKACENKEKLCVNLCNPWLNLFQVSITTRAQWNFKTLDLLHK